VPALRSAFSCTDAASSASAGARGSINTRPSGANSSATTCANASPHFAPAQYARSIRSRCSAACGKRCSSARSAALACSISGGSVQCASETRAFDAASSIRNGG
jgi:hypothetical protein